MRNIQEFSEAEMAVIHAVAVSEYRRYSPVQGCRSELQPCHMTGVRARDSPSCRYFQAYRAMRLDFAHAVQTAAEDA